MTLNLQYFASYPKGEDGEEIGRKKLEEITGSEKSPAPDVICVQEGLASKDVLGDVGFDLKVCAGAAGKAQSVYDMVYGDEFTLKSCPQESHKELLCNQIYLRRGSDWELIDCGVDQISSDLQLVGGGGRAQGKLAIRSMVWAKLRRSGSDGPCVYVMCTHITGGRFEDQYFVQQLAEERRHQPDRIMKFFEEHPDRGPHDVAVLLGDFNATKEYTSDGAMHGYFKSAIESSEGVKADARAANVQEDQLEELFKAYMVSPFKSIIAHGWSFAYDTEIGVTSGFGHLIDHMAMSRPLKVISADVIYVTNQKFLKTKDTDVVLTDHNSVKTRFLVEASEDAVTGRRPQGMRALLLSMGLLGAAAYGYFSLVSSATGPLSRATA